MFNWLSRSREVLLKSFCAYRLPRGLSQDADFDPQVWGDAGDLTFLTSSLEIPVLLVCGLHSATQE